jgi:prevent-host-death family protein
MGVTQERRDIVVQRMSAKEARTRFTDVLGRAYYRGEPTIVEKQGKPVAVVISPEDYERYQRLAKERFFQVVRQIQEDNKDKDPDEVYRDVTEAVEEVRREMYDRR